MRILIAVLVVLALVVSLDLWGEHNTLSGPIGPEADQVIFPVPASNSSLGELQHQVADFCGAFNIEWIANAVDVDATPEAVSKEYAETIEPSDSVRREVAYDACLRELPR